ncbi:MAG TPA: glucoamylase family protein [Nitrosospira sp.]|nr:glucoamylase family protein [Nitrosospira sp.]
MCQDIASKSWSAFIHEVNPTNQWTGYDEALIIYLLGLGSPTHPLSEESYAAWTSTYKWKKIYDIEFLYAGPLFVHQLSHVWIDFRIPSY